MSEHSYAIPTIKKLFGLSGNVCAFPSCNERIVDENGNVFGEICHIKAARPNEPRHDKKQTPKQRKSYENLILFCPNHHSKTDDDSVYTVQKLKQMKKDHEEKFRKNPFIVPEAQLPKIMDQVLAKLEKIEKYVEKLPEIKSDTGRLIELSESIMKRLTDQKIENEFDLKKQSASTIVASLGQIGNKLKETSDDYDYNIGISKDSSSIEVSHKNLNQMNKKGMTFETTIKLNNEKAKNLDELINESKEGKIILKAEEIERITISKEGKPVYVAQGLPQAELTISKNKPKPYLTKLVVPDTQESLDYLLLTATKENNVVTLSNENQKDHPIAVKIILDLDSNNIQLTLTPKFDQSDVSDAYKHLKFLNAFADKKTFHVVERETDEKIFTMVADQTFTKTPPYSMELLEKLVKIQKLTRIKFPWPPDRISPQDQINIHNAYEIVTKGRTTGSVGCNMKIQKGEPAGEIFVKKLAEDGFCEYKLTTVEEMKISIFGKEFSLGKFRIKGKITTDSPPLDFIKEYQQKKIGDIIRVRVIALDGKAEIEYEDWPKKKSNFKKISTF